MRTQKRTKAIANVFGFANQKKLNAIVTNIVCHFKVTYMKVYPKRI